MVDATTGFELHHALGIAKAHPRERVDHCAQALRALQVLAPLRGRIAIHGVQKFAVVRAPQRVLHLGGQRQRVRAAPAWQHAGVHQQHGVTRHIQRQCQGLLAQPVQQDALVAGGEHLAQGVAPAGAAHAVRHCQQMQVVVAQQAARRAVERHEPPQHTQGIGAAVDQVAQQIEGVAAGGKSDVVQQARQGAVAALHVTDQVKCHVFIFAPDPWNSC